MNSLPRCGAGPADRRAARAAPAVPRARRRAASLYVFQVRGDRERGAGGWVYKVGRRLPGAQRERRRAGRLRSGQRVTWFWCAQAGRCQRTLGDDGALVAAGACA